jgi:hypothetical protein
MSKQNSLVIHRSGEKNTHPLLPYPKSFKTRSSRMRDINAKTSNLSLGSTITVNISSELSSKAAKNGDGVVYNPSDCGFPNVRWYGCGGDCAPSACGNHFLNRAQLEFIWVKKDFNIPLYHETLNYLRQFGT